MIKLEWKESEEDPKWLIVFVEGEKWRYVHKSLFFKHIKNLQNLSNPKELEEKFALLERKIAKEEALRFLSQRSYSSQELKNKLQRKALSEEASREAVKECIRLGYIDDLQFVDVFIQKQKSKGYGSHLIAHKLKEKGIKVEKETVFSLEEEKENIRILLQKPKYKKRLSSPSERKKILSSLQRRGFSLGHIYAAIREEARELGET